MTAIRGLSAARDLPQEVILEALKDALVSAYHKMPEGKAGNVSVDFDDDGHTRVHAHYAVVEEAYLEDPSCELTVEQARKIDPKAYAGDIVDEDVTPADFGRIAAQTAKQVILQRIREAEREQTYSTYADREGEIVYGVTQTVNRDMVTVALDRVEAVLPKSGQIPGERYSPNQRLRVYVAEVKRSPKGPQVIVSRTHREMLRSLMVLEIPEIHQGVVEIKAIAREAGSRSKVAVWASQAGVDPVGACVGMRGVRIQALVRELGGEKIDIVEWEADPRVFIAHALSPAKVMHVWLEEDSERRTANVIVPDNQLSLAIGREGQNARLAAKLTGWRIDIRSESEAGDLIERLEREAKKAPRVVPVSVEAASDSTEPAEIADPEIETIAAELLVAEAEAIAPEAIAASGAAVLPVEAAAEATAETTDSATKTQVAAEAAAAFAPAAESAAETPDGEPAAWNDWDGVKPKEMVRPRQVTAADASLEEDEDFEAGGKGKRRKARRLVRDPKTGEVVATHRRKKSRQRPEWKDDVGRWSDDDMADALGITEYDFVDDDAEDEES
jgi:N utilization substance protein A